MPLQPSFRRKPESMPTGGVYSLRNPLQPSFRRKPESMLASYITVVADYDPAYVCITAMPLQPSFRRKPESIGGGGRAFGGGGSPTTVIPAQAGIYACWLHYRSRRLRPGVRFHHCDAPTTVIPAKAGIYACRLHYRSSILRPGVRFHHCDAPTTVIPAQAGIYACRLHHRSSRLRRRILAQAAMTFVGHRNDENVPRTAVNPNMTTPPGPTSAGAAVPAVPFHPIPKIAPPK